MLEFLRRLIAFFAAFFAAAADWLLRLWRSQSGVVAAQWSSIDIGAAIDNAQSAIRDGVSDCGHWVTQTTSSVWHVLSRRHVLIGVANGVLLLIQAAAISVSMLLVVWTLPPSLHAFSFFSAVTHESEIVDGESRTIGWLDSLKAAPTTDSRIYSAYDWLQKKYQFACGERLGHFIVRERCADLDRSGVQPLHDFDAILHTVFEFSVGLGFIIWMTDLGFKQLGLTWAFLQDSWKWRSATRFYSGWVRLWAKTTFFGELLLSAVATFGLVLTVVAVWFCFLATASITGYLLMIVPLRPEIVVLQSAYPAYVSYAVAPAVETVLLLVIVGLLLCFRVTSPRRLEFYARPDRYISMANSVLGELDDGLGQMPSAPPF
ncbi:MAG TPA: hypothetical protein VMF58_12925 [Rhizomicrobium sp.]|nr:hypothetical protein [Rhizomicrobium sp.]